MNDSRQRVAKCFSSVFPDLSAEEIEKASTVTVSAWDSVAAITLVNVLEEEFQTMIDFDAMADLNSFELVAAYMQRIQSSSQET